MPCTAVDFRIRTGRVSLSAKPYAVAQGTALRVGAQWTAEVPEACSPINGAGLVS